MAVKVAPSVLSADFGEMAKAVRDLDSWGADWIHCDVMDGVFVSNITFGMDMIKALRKHTGSVLDVHLMITRPERYVKRFLDAGADVLTFHPDASENVTAALAEIKRAGKLSGLVLNPDKPLSLVEPYLDYMDVLVIMGVYAGFGGQKFIPDMLDKIREARKLVEGRNIVIEMDGGAAADNFAPLAEAGTDVIVTGSALFRSDDPAGLIEYLHGLEVSGKGGSSVLAVPDIPDVPEESDEDGEDSFRFSDALILDPEDTLSLETDVPEDTAAAGEAPAEEAPEDGAPDGEDDSFRFHDGPCLEDD